MAKKPAAAPSPFASIDDFREAAKAAGDKHLEGAHIRASFDTEVEVKDATDESSRTLLFTISTANVDRMGDTIALDGWELDNFRKNPVVLWAHDATSPPVAKAPRVWIEGTKLRAEAEFVPADNPAVGRFAEGIFQLYKGGFMSATSVGFSPKRYAFADRKDGSWGIDFMQQELLEYSAVPVPANADALIEGKAAGIDIAPVLDFCTLMLAKAQDGGRILKLAESVIGGTGQDLVTLAWAEKIANAHGKGLFSRDRIAAIEKAATADRLARKRHREITLAKLRGQK